MPCRDLLLGRLCLVSGGQLFGGVRGDELCGVRPVLGGELLERLRSVCRFGSSHGRLVLKVAITLENVSLGENVLEIILMFFHVLICGGCWSLLAGSCMLWQAGSFKFHFTCATHVCSYLNTRICTT